MELKDLQIKISKLTVEDLNFLFNFGSEPILRKLMTSDEISICNYFVKKGIMIKGTSDDKYKNRQYYIDSSVYRYILAEQFNNINNNK